MPSVVLDGKTPYNILCPSQPLFHIDPRIFGCVCFVRDVRPNLTKLDPKSLKCVFLGYSRVQKGYRCYSPKLGKYLVSIDVTFHEDVPFFPSSPDAIGQGEDEGDDILMYTVTTSVPMHVPTPPVLQVYSRRHTFPDSP